MAKKLNTINKMTYATWLPCKQAPLATKTKQREDKCCARATEEATYVNKTTMASINSAQHTQHMEGAEHQRKSERKQTTSSAGSAALSPLARGSGRDIAAGRAAFRTSAGRVTEALAMLSEERTAKNKKRRYMTSRGMKLKAAISLWQRIKILHSIASDARVQGKKTC